MIQPNELRIGNWFQQDASNNNTISRFFTVDEIKRYGVRSTYIRQDTNQPHTSLFSLDSIHPIPLTPEILEKCGLKNGNSELDRNVFYSTNKHLAQFSVNISGSFGIYVGVFIALRSVHLEYLHQLQNLYFALTNTELNYTP